MRRQFVNRSLIHNDIVIALFALLFVTMEQLFKFLRSKRIRDVLVQVLFLFAIIAFIAILFYNTATNLEARGIITSAKFLGEVAPFGIGFSPVVDFQLGTSTYFDILLIGIVNTLLVSLAGVFAAALFGFFFGVMRLSRNWLIATIASWYIEVFRNIPLLLQIMFWYFAVYLAVLPEPSSSISFAQAVFLSKSGVTVPEIGISSAWRGILYLASLIIAVAFVYILRRRWQLTQDTTGKQIPKNTLSVIIITAVAIVGTLVLNPFTVTMPEFSRFSFSVGTTIPLSLFVLWFALSVYTGAFIAETVRSGILAVPHGQSEASDSLCLTHAQSLRLVIIPQSMRVIIPPTISQYLNLAKNSSLAVAIGYEDIVNIFTGVTLNNTGQAVIIVAITLLVYQSISLSTSALMNWYNKRAQIITR